MRVTIGARLGLGFLIMLLLVAAAGLASVIAVARLGDLTAVLALESDEVRRITDIRVAVAEADRALERAIAAGQEEDIAAAAAEQSELQDMAETYIDSKEAAGSDEEMLGDLRLAQQTFDQTYDSWLELAAASAGLGSWAYQQRQDIAVDPYIAVLNDIESAATGRMATAMEETQQAESSLILIMIGFTVVAALIGTGLAVAITRSVTVPVGKLLKAADEVSLGHLDAPMEVDSRDEIGELAESMERMRVSMKAAMERLKRRR
jgi:HAMP domain-containing protein